jgi:hypothetical protein
MVEIAVLDECEKRLALEGARALETAFDWDERPIEAEGCCWCKLQDLLLKIAGTTFEAEQERLVAAGPLAA